MSPITRLLLVIVLSASLPAAAQDITYQGQLQDGGQPVNGTVSMDFVLYDNDDGSGQLGEDGPYNVEVTEGLFQVELDFGDVYANVPVYLEVIVEGDPLNELQTIHPAPAAHFADSVPWSGITGEPEFWRLDGNAGTTPGTDILGTTDDTPLELHVNGQRALRLEPVGSSPPNLIGGSDTNTISTSLIGATIGGGNNNSSTGSYTAIGGGSSNSTGNFYATVGGGVHNSADAYTSTIGGGSHNAILADFGVIAGGGPSNTSDSFNTSNVVYDQYGTISGGGHNQAGSNDGDPESADYATIGGGESNVASGKYAVVGGGRFNSASSWYAVVPGGRENEAMGDYSFAAGNRAKAEHDGTFVWADSSSFDPFSSTAVDQFLVRADGGVGINEDTPLAALHVESAADEDTLRVRVDGGTGLRVAENRGVSIGTALDAPNRGLKVHGEVELNSLGAGGTELCITSSDIVSDCTTSSRRFKENIQSLDRANELIERLRAVRFDWKETGEADIGLIAEEVAEVEPDLVNFDDDGEVRGVKYRQLSVVLISAMQEQRTKIESWRQETLDRVAALESENARLRLAVEQNTELAERNRELEARLTALESVLLEEGDLARAER